MRIFKFIVLFACFAIVVFGQRTRFDNYRMHSVNIENLRQLNMLRKLEIGSLIKGILFRSFPFKIGQTVDLITPPSKLAKLLQLFAKYALKNQIRTDNLQKYVSKTFRFRAIFSWKCFRFREIDGLMQNSH